MRFAKKFIVLMLATVLVLGLFESAQVDAKEITIAAPKISIKTAKNEAGIKLTIKKTKDAEGYEVYLTYEADNSLYKDGDDLYCYDNFSCQEKLVKNIDLSGTKKRTVTINSDELINENCKSLPAGKYTIKVKSYNKKKFSTTRYSEFSKAKSLTIKAKKVGSGYKSSYDFSGTKKGDVITFGAYEQDGNFNNGQEPIEWVVLNKTKSQIFAVSKYALDRLPYNKQDADVTWETCTLRKWLNDKFYNAAFNKTEKGMIKTTTVENYDNAVYDTPGGKDTKDKIFLLSQLEMIEPDYGFAETYAEYDINRRCAPSIYNKAREVYYHDDYKTADGLETCYWWLRTPGKAGRGIHMCYVNRDGNVGSSNSFIDYGCGYYDGNGVRPALVISLK